MAEHQGEKLHSYLKGLKKPIEEIAKDLGLSRGSLYYYFRSSELEPETIELLKSRGYYPPAERVADSTASPVEFNEKNNIVYIPLYAYGGFLQGYSNKVFMDTLQKFSLPGIHGEHYAFQIQGESMSPFVTSGDIVIGRKEEQLGWMVKGRPYVLQTVDGILVKMFDKISDGKAHFNSTDKSGGSPVIPLKDIKGIYQVVKVLKDFVNIGPYK